MTAPAHVLAAAQYFVDTQVSKVMRSWLWASVIDVEPYTAYCKTDCLVVACLAEGYTAKQPVTGEWAAAIWKGEAATTSTKPVKSEVLAPIVRDEALNFTVKTEMGEPHHYEGPNLSKLQWSTPPELNAAERAVLREAEGARKENACCPRCGRREIYCAFGENASADADCYKEAYRRVLGLLDELVSAETPMSPYMIQACREALKGLTIP